MEIKSQKALCLPGGTDASCDLLWHNVIDTLLSKEEEKVRTEQKLLCCPQRRSLFRIKHNNKHTLCEGAQGACHVQKTSMLRLLCGLFCSAFTIILGAKEQNKETAKLFPLKGSSQQDS